MKKILSIRNLAFLIACTLLFGFNAMSKNGMVQDNKITVWKGKDDSFYSVESGEICKGSGHKCAEMTVTELAELIRVAKEK